MSISTLPRRWSAMLTLAGLSLILTLVTGVGAEECGRNSRCGYGTRCDTNTTQCVCLSDNGELKKREGNPISVFYCLSEGVTECGGRLCGYRAVCGTNGIQCQYPSSTHVPTEMKGTSPSLWYCVETCTSSDRSCPMNTTCTENDRSFLRCTCSAAATLSSTGQCLGMHATTVKSPSVQLTPQGEEVTQCGDRLCGYGAGCNTNRETCICPSTKGVLQQLTDTSPSLWFCLESCSPVNKTCPVNTTCMDPPQANIYRCQCSAGATLSSTGQCLAPLIKTTASAGPSTTTTADPNPDKNIQSVASDCNALTVGLAVGFGEALCLAVIFVVVVLIRKHRRMKARETSQDSVLRNTNSVGNLSSVEAENSYENVVSCSSLEQEDPGVQIEMGIPRTDVQPTVIDNSPSYEPPQSAIDNDTSGLYESANVAGSPGDRLYTTLSQT